MKERLPANLLTYTVPLGMPETVKEGIDITIVTYGSTLRIVLEAAETLEKMHISCEVIDIQTLLLLTSIIILYRRLKKPTALFL
jgi:pyruvate/2-oxoglutarate/acetoin dehydrogenase E1 component